MILKVYAFENSHYPCGTLSKFFHRGCVNFEWSIPIYLEDSSRGDRGRLQLFLPNWSYYLYYSEKATKADFIWKGHLSAWFLSGFEVTHTHM